MNRENNYLKILVTANIILLVARVIWILYGNIPLHSEEAQYWLWSKHLDLSYYSKPPLIAYAIFLSTQILGDSVLGIRIIAILIGFIVPLVTYRFALELFKSSKIAFYSTIILFTLPHYHYLSMILSTDSLVILFWLLTILFAWQAIQHDSLKDWLLTGISLGFGIMSKYTMLLWIPSLLLINWIFRLKLLKNKRFYFSLGLAGIICTPIIVWNITTGFVGFKHIFGLMGAYKPFAGIGISLTQVVEYTAGQLGSLVPFYLPAIYLLIKKRNGIQISEDQFPVSFLSIPLLFVLTFFAFVAIRKTEINWTYFAFVAYPILLGYASVKFIDKKKLRLALSATALLIFIMFLPSAFGRLGAKIYPPKIDPFHKMAGWEDLGKTVSGIAKNMEDEKLFIFSDRYQIASELAFYMEDNPQTYCINNGRRMNQFDLWPGINQFAGKGYNAIYVSPVPIPDYLRECFKKVEFITDQKCLYHQSEVDTPFLIYYLTEFETYNPQKNPLSF
jgi:4-amino-4-deoxy-L-arabinose transferase-like glycosyltransferase